MTTATAEAPAGYLVDCDPISQGECAAMADAAAAFGARFAVGHDMGVVLARIRGLCKPFRSPEISMGFHVAHSWIYPNGQPGSAHWKDSFFYPGQTEPISYDARTARQGAVITGAAWAAARAAGYGTDQARTALFRGVFDPAWLAELPTPTREQRPQEQMTALAAVGQGFTRYDSPEELDDAYAQQPRTYLFEALNATHGWAQLASRWLGALSASDRSVLVDAFDSRHGDDRLGTHHDCWFNVSIQLSGAKDWKIGYGLTQPGREVVTHTMRAGDVLVIPHGVPHDVSTPADPGHSRHLIFPLDRREPDQLAA